MIALATVYFALNTILALGMHISTLHSTLERPKVPELLVYFILFFLAGLPLLLLAIAFRTVNSTRSGRPRMPNTRIPQFRTVRYEKGWRQ